MHFSHNCPWSAPRPPWSAPAPRNPRIYLCLWTLKEVLLATFLKKQEILWEDMTISLIKCHISPIYFCISLWLFSIPSFDTDLTLFASRHTSTPLPPQTPPLSLIHYRNLLETRSSKFKRSRMQFLHFTVIWEINIPIFVWTVYKCCLTRTIPSFSWLTRSSRATFTLNLQKKTHFKFYNILILQDADKAFNFTIPLTLGLPLPLLLPRKL